jgi:SNF2-related domain
MALSARTFGKAVLKDGQWWLMQFPPYISMKLKGVFRTIPLTAVKEFRLKHTPQACADLLWFFQRYPFIVSQADQTLLEDGHKDMLRREAEVDSILSGGWQPVDMAFFKQGFSPYKYQAEASAIAVSMTSLLLMDDVGLGKTVSALDTIARSGALPAAVVVQSHLAEQWVEEFIKPFTNFRAHIIKGTTPYELPDADIYVFKYSNIAGWVDYFTQDAFPIVIFDEMQELRHGGGTAKGRAAKVLGEQASYRMGLTATPIYNYGSEIYNIANILRPGCLGDWFGFITEWCYIKGQNYVVADPDALGAYLRDITVTLRRSETDVDGQLPPVNVMMHHIDYDEEIVSGLEVEARVLAQRVLTGSFTERGQAARELDMLARHATGVAKAKSVAALVRMLVESGEHVTVAGWHRDVYDIWNKELADLNPLMYTGSESNPAKQRTKEAFLSGPPRPLIMSLRSGAGIDGLQKVCSKVVLGELDWSPQVHKQLIGRFRRPGQKKQVDAIYCHTNGGSDPVLVELLGLKSSQSHGIVDPLKQVQPVHSDDSRMKMLARQYLGLEMEAAE